MYLIAISTGGCCFVIGIHLYIRLNVLMNNVSIFSGFASPYSKKKSRLSVKMSSIDVHSIVAMEKEMKNNSFDLSSFFVCSFVAKFQSVFF